MDDIALVKAIGEQMGMVIGAHRLRKPTDGDFNDNGDSNDNGVNSPEPAVNGVCSNPVDLIFFTEPMNEPDFGPPVGQYTDVNITLTVDFGFISSPTALEEGEEPGTIFDRFW